MLSAKPWQPMAVLQYCAAVLFSICAGGIVSGVLQKSGVPGFRDMAEFGTIFLGTFVFQGIACILIFVFFWWHKVGWRVGFGFSGPNLQRALRLALMTFALALPSVWILQFASVFTLTKLGHPPDDQAAVQLIESATGWTRGYLCFFAVGLAPVAEEFIFRGMLYPFIKQLGWPKSALIGLSLLFALIHFDAGTFFALFFLALILTWLYEKTDNLLAPIIVHSLFNATNLGMIALKQSHILPN